VLARSQVIRLPSGDQFATPLLIPSLSSKGFDTIEIEGRQISAVSGHLDVVARDLNEALLVSAYDIAHGYLRQSSAFSSDFVNSVFANPKVLVIDSGGYEANPSASDLSEQYHFAFTPKPWHEEELVRTIDRMSADVKGVLVNFDRYGQPAEQAEAAGTYFRGRDRFLGDFLVKPVDPGAYLDWRAVIEAAEALGEFAILGVTEKELGDTVEDRIVTIAELRRAMDERGIPQPIHIFGALDPIYTPLYFLAGAEIFDGLTWLRYAYHTGLTIYAEMLPALEGNLKMRTEQRVARFHVSNLAYLRDLERSMREYAHRPDPALLSTPSPYLWSALDKLSTEVRELL
jgi:hypothetical protein